MPLADKHQAEGNQKVTSILSISRKGVGMKLVPQDDASREIRRVGAWVVLAILIWSAGWLTVHKIAEARHHAVAVHSRG